MNQDHSAPRHHRWLLGSLALAVIVLLCVLSFLAGAAVSKPGRHSENIELPDGENVTCVLSDAGAVDCNWGAVNLNP